MRWSEDDPDLFAMMEKTKMYIFRRAAWGGLPLSDAVRLQAVLLGWVLHCRPEGGCQGCSSDRLSLRARLGLKGWVQTRWLSPAWLPCRGLDPEEPIVSTANLCIFNHLEVTVRIPACSLSVTANLGTFNHLEVTARTQSATGCAIPFPEPQCAKHCSLHSRLA